MAEPLPALSVQVPQPTEGGGVSAINPFQAGLDIMRMRQLNNENQQFQLQQWANRGIAGIMSQHPGDEEGGLREILASPFAPYAPGFVAQVRESNASLANTHKTNLETQKMGGEIVQTGLNGFIKTTVPMLYDAILKGANTDQLSSIFQGQRGRILAGMPPALRDQFGQGLDAWWTGMTTGVDKMEPNAAKAYMLNNFHNSTIGAGFSAEDWAHAYGKPETITQTIRGPDGKPMTVVTPVMRDQQTGAIRTVPGAGGTPQMYTPGIEPGYHEPGMQPYGTGGPGGNALMPPNIGGPGFTGVPSYPGAGPAPTLAPSPSAASPVPSVAPSAPAATQAPAASAIETAGDDTPLWTPEAMANNPPQGGFDASGTRWVWQDPGKAEQATKNQESYAGEMRTAYNSRQKQALQLTAMDDNLNTLAGTTLEPGASGEERTRVLRQANTAAKFVNSFVGQNLLPEITDERTLASAEGLIKEMRLAQFETVRSEFGAQREAGSVIMSALQAVPGMDTSLLGNKLVLEGLRADSRRDQDLYKFQGQWMNTHHGDLTGADAVFNRLHPPEQYAQAVFNKMGFGPNGFTSRAAILNANAHNWINPEQAQRELKKFPRITSP